MLYVAYAVIGLLVGVVLMFFTFSTIQARNHRRRKPRSRAASESRSEATRDDESKKPPEFSKVVLGFVMLTYFVGLGFGIYAVNKILLEYPEWAIQALIAIFGYVGAPITTAIGFYSWKAKAENTLKIIKKNPKETEGTTFDPTNIIG